MQRGWPFALALGAVVGVVVAFAIVWHARRLGYSVFEFDRPALDAWIFFSLFLMAGVPTCLLVGDRFVAPALVFVFAIALWLRSEADPGPGEPFIGFVFLAPVVVVLMLLLAGIELWLRTAVS